MNWISASGDKYSDGAQGTRVVVALPQGSGGETHTGVAHLGEMSAERVAALAGQHAAP